MHYARWQRHGDPHVTLQGDGGVAGFEARVDRSGGPDACHPWLGCTDDKGYGVVQFDGRLQRAHQVAWQIVNGPVPQDTELDHVCHNQAVKAGECKPGSCPHRACANERHIVPKTRQQHVRDTDRTHWRGETHNMSKLTEQQVREVRGMLADGQAAGKIGALYGVSESAVNRIRQGRSWAWLA
jgi:hypothetical protein